LYNRSEDTSLESYDVEGDKMSVRKMKRYPVFAINRYIKSLQKDIAFLMLLIFIMNITGVLFSLHIHCTDDCEEHDSTHCSICQNTFVNTGKGLAVASDDQIAFDTLLTLFFYESSDFHGQFSPLSASPRAPPVV
jgi:hypothetical protein